MTTDRTERGSRESPPELRRAERLVEEALLAGAVEAEVYIKSSVTTGISLGPRFTSFTGGTESGIALRVFDGEGGVGHAFSSARGGREAREVIRAALMALKAAEREGGRSLVRALPAARWAGSSPDPEGLVDPRVRRWGPEEKRELLDGALREAAEDLPGSACASYRDGTFRVTLATSRGLLASYARTLCLVNLTRGSRRGPTLHAEWVGTGPDRKGILEAAASLARLQAEGPDEKMPTPDLLLEGPAAVSLIRRLARDLVENPADPDGQEDEPPIQRVASEMVTIVDDGRLPGGVATASFDGEGVPTGRLTLVKAGIRIDRLRSPRPGELGRPGASVRASYRDLPAPGGTNLFVVPGPRPFSDILSGMSEGFVLGALESDGREDRPESSGAVWRGIGHEVRAGSPTGRCRRILFRSGVGDLFEGIQEVSDRLHFALRGGVAVGSPALLIRSRR